MSILLKLMFIPRRHFPRVVPNPNTHTQYPIKTSGTTEDRQESFSSMTPHFAHVKFKPSRSPIEGGILKLILHNSSLQSGAIISFFKPISISDGADHDVSDGLHGNCPPLKIMYNCKPTELSLHSTNANLPLVREIYN